MDKPTDAPHADPTADPLLAEEDACALHHIQRRRGCLIGDSRNSVLARTGPWTQLWGLSVVWDSRQRFAGHWNISHRAPRICWVESPSSAGGRFGKTHESGGTCNRSSHFLAVQRTTCVMARTARWPARTNVRFVETPEGCSLSGFTPDRLRFQARSCVC